MILADLACRVGACGVEVAQPRGLQPVSPPEIIHHSFANELGEAVWIDRIEPGVLDNRNWVRLAINGATRREYDHRNTRRAPSHRATLVPWTLTS